MRYRGSGRYRESKVLEAAIDMQNPSYWEQCSRSQTYYLAYLISHTYSAKRGNST